jgi:hypothetical protein
VNPIDWKVRSGGRQKDFPLNFPAVRCPGNWRVYADPVPADQRRKLRSYHVGRAHRVSEDAIRDCVAALERESAIRNSAAS